MAPQNQIECEDEEACRMRQSAPFAGILTPKEVWKLKREFKNKLDQSPSQDGLMPAFCNLTAVF